MPINFIERSAFDQPVAMSKKMSVRYKGVFRALPESPEKLRLFGVWIITASLTTYSLQTPKRQGTMAYISFSLKPCCSVLSRS